MITLQKSVKLRQKEEVVCFGQKVEFKVVRQKWPLNFPV